nr:hypothetical protein BaRGS_029627 [Batillaria attramentaria]
MDSTVRIDVPPNHTAMVSFEGLDMDDLPYRCDQLDRLTLYIGGASESDVKWTLCSWEDVRLPELHETDVLYVRFVTDNDEPRLFQTYSGFKLRFSFHEQSEVLRKLRDGMWNCSVPYFANYHQHFPCNLASECHNDEDEMRCPYSDNVCGPKKLSLGGRCYIYVNPDTDLTWNEASVMCLLRGARLVSFNTLEEWQTVAPLLVEFDIATIYTGLQTIPPSLPTM